MPYIYPEILESALSWLCYFVPCTNIEEKHTLDQLKRYLRKVMIKITNDH